MQKLSVVNGFCFEDEKTGRAAQKEAEAIRYIKAKTNLNAPEAVWNVYTKLVDNQMFVTPVGLSFLHELYQILLDTGKVSEESMPKISVKTGSAIQTTDSSAVTVAAKEGQQAMAGLKDDIEKVMEPETPDESIRQDAELEEKRLIWAHDAEFEKQKRKLASNKNTIRNLKIVIFMLAVGFISLLAVVYFSDDSKFINAETKVIDQYSEWEQSLQEKEAELNEREQIILEKEKKAE